MFLLIISSVALLIFLFSMDLSWANLISNRRNDLVFEGRNQNYGAYVLRREHHVNVFYALLLSVGLIGGGMCVLQFLVRKAESVISVPDVVDIGPITNINPTKIKPDLPDKPDRGTARASAAASGGSLNNEVTVVEQGAQSTATADPQGGGGDGPSDLIQPYDPGSAGGGEGLDKPENDNSDKKKRHVFVKNMPEFPGGMNEFIRYVQSKMKYTEYELMHNVGGTMYVSFTIFPDGNVGEIVIERGIPYGERLERRVTKVLLEMPQWKPGDNGDQPLAVIMKMPLKFELRP
jgi:protein TonB